jgi:ATP-dependent RNA helicase DDX47/RRP3
MEKEQANFGLVIAPTRELAHQIRQAIEALGAIIGVRVAILIGGDDMVTQAISLSKKPHIIVATPGRLLDHLQNTKGFHLRALKYLILDEADRLLDLDFSDILDKILKNIPPRKTMLFSATETKKVEALQRASLKDPVRIAISADDDSVPTAPGVKTKKAQIPSTLIQSYMFLPYVQKDQYLVHLLNISLANQMTIVFVRTIKGVNRLTHLLTALGLKPSKLHGELSQPDRLASLAKFKSRQRTILIATDLMARGLDIPAVDAVVNYDLPDASTTYVHRVGRTARAGKSGKAISFVTQYDVEILLRIEKELGRKLETFEGQPSEDQVLMLGEAVKSAQAAATKKLKEAEEKKGAKKGHRGGKRTKEDMDRGEE